MKRENLTSSEAFQIYKNKLLLLSPEDLPFRISAFVGNMVILAASDGAQQVDGTDNGTYEYSDCELFEADIRDCQRARPHFLGRQK